MIKMQCRESRFCYCTIVVLRGIGCVASDDDEEDDKHTTSRTVSVHTHAQAHRHTFGAIIERRVKEKV